jgi:hypothetical protein
MPTGRVPYFLDKLLFLWEGGGDSQGRGSWVCPGTSELKPVELTCLSFSEIFLMNLLLAMPAFIWPWLNTVIIVFFFVFFRNWACAQLKAKKQEHFKFWP